MVWQNASLPIAQYVQSDNVKCGLVDIMKTIIVLEFILFSYEFTLVKNPKYMNAVIVLFKKISSLTIIIDN